LICRDWCYKTTDEAEGRRAIDVTNDVNRESEDKMPGVGPTMKEFKAGTLHSGSKNGPVGKSKKQALAIGLNSERQLGKRVAGMVKKG